MALCKNLVPAGARAWALKLPSFACLLSTPAVLYSVLYRGHVAPACSVIYTYCASGSTQPYVSSKRLRAGTAMQHQDWTRIVFGSNLKSMAWTASVLLSRQIAYICICTKCVLEYGLPLSKSAIALARLIVRFPPLMLIDSHLVLQNALCFPCIQTFPNQQH